MKNKINKLLLSSILLVLLLPAAPAQSLNGSDPMNSSSTSESITPIETVLVVPTAYNVTGGGAYCSGDPGVLVGLDNSESGVTYTLLKNGTALAPTVPGTGSAISFGLQTVGIYTVEGTNISGTTLMNGNATVTENTRPIPTLAGPASLCAGTTGNVYTTEAGMSNYSWVVSAGGTITNGGTSSSNTVVVTWTAAGARTVGVNYQNSVGCAAAVATSYAVTVGAPPASPSPISGVIVPCEASIQNYSVTAVAGVTYTWTVPFGFTILSGQGSSSISVQVGASGGDISVLSLNTCGIGGVSSGYITVSPLPAAAGTIAGTPGPCVGNTFTYSVLNTPATTYTWTVPAGWTILSGQGTNSITTQPSTTAGSISVTPSNTCGSAIPSTKAVTPITIPAATSPINGAADTCANATGLIYSVTPVAGITHTWILPNGWSVVSGQGTSTITVNAGAAGGVISVYPSNNCGTGPASTKSVVLNQVPAQPTPLTGPVQACAGDTLGFKVPLIAGETYQWTVPAGWAIVTGQGTDSLTVVTGFNGGTVAVVASNECGSGIPATLAIVVNFVLADAGTDQTITPGSSTTLFGNATAGSGNYGWIWTPASLLLNATVQNPQTVNLMATTSFFLTVSDLTTSCHSTDTVVVVAQYNPMALVATATPDSICSGEPVQLLATVTGGTGSYTFVWTSNPAGFSSTLPNPVVNPEMETDYTVIVNDGLNVVYEIVTVSMFGQPDPPAMPAGPDSVNINNTPTSVYSTQPVANAVAYNWEILPSMIGSMSPNGPEVTVTWQAIGSAFLVVTAIGECGEATSEVKMVKVDNTIGIHESENPTITLYPNPVRDRLYIGAAINITEIEVVGMTGEVHLRQTLNEGLTHAVDLKNLATGIYTIRMKTTEGVMVKKIVRI